MNRRMWGAAAAAVIGLLAVAGADGLTQPGGKGFGGPGFGKEKRKLVEQFDKNGDGWLNQEERAAARESLKKDGRGGGKFGFGGKGGFGKGGGEPPKPGPKVDPSDVKTYSTGLYDPDALRTIFLRFENADWEAELEEFHDTDVEVPAAMVVDGKTYPNVGVHFRGMSSYMGVGRGSKRSLNVSVDLADKKQKLYGYKTLNLLNSHDDPGMMSTVLYSHVARKYIPTPKANFVKVVINGESWGVYVSAQQFDKVFLQDHFKTDKGFRWKVRGSPGGRGGLEYMGDRVDDYKRVFEMKGAVEEDRAEKAWKALITLCKTLNETPPDRLEAALAPVLDIDGVLWFLALDVALVNNDGYWTRASDYTLYLDPKGKFHLVPHDMNEAFRGGGGPGGPGGFRMAMPRPGEVLPPFLQDGLGMTPQQKEQMAALQKEVDEKLDRIMTAEQRAQLKRMREGGPPGFGGPGGPGGPPGGPGGPGGMGPRGGGVELDPLVGLDNPRTPLRSKLLAVPALRERYLAKVRTIAEESLDWQTLGPVVAKYRALIEDEVKADTRKLDPFAEFSRLTANETPKDGGRGRGTTLRAFAEQRRKFLLDHPEVKKLPR